MFALEELRKSWLSRLKNDDQYITDSRREIIVEGFMRDVEALVGGKFKLVIVDKETGIHLE